MDIIVVRYPDGSLRSSPFHLRFGTLKILKAKEKIVYNKLYLLFDHISFHNLTLFFIILYCLIN